MANYANSKIEQTVYYDECDIFNEHVEIIILKKKIKNALDLIEKIKKLSINTEEPSYYSIKYGDLHKSLIENAEEEIKWRENKIKIIKSYLKPNDNNILNAPTHESE